MLIDFPPPPPMLVKLLLNTTIGAKILSQNFSMLDYLHETNTFRYFAIPLHFKLDYCLSTELLSEAHKQLGIIHRRLRSVF